MMGFGLIFILLVVGLVMYVFGWRPRGFNFQSPHDQNRSPLDILNERYARGEISREQYEEMRKVLNQ